MSRYLSAPSFNLLLTVAKRRLKLHAYHLQQADNFIVPDETFILLMASLWYINSKNGALTSVNLLLGQRLQRWPNNKLTHWVAYILAYVW